MLRRDVTLIPWPIESTPAIRCIVGGIGIIVMSFFPLELAVRDPHYRWLAGGTFIGAFLTGVLFLWAGWKFARKVRE